MVNFRGRITKNFVRIPNKIMSDEGFQNGESVSISIERIEV
jgi:antitoxin component of MazEF toxin-antitoxin module